MLNIVTVKWGTKYDARYVNNLYLGFKNFSSYPYNFHCFTDDPSELWPGIITHELPSGIPIWWNKLYLFSNECPVKGQILYVDLDTVVVDKIDHILKFADENDKFIMLKDVYHQERWGSGIMAFQANGQYSYLWDSFYPQAQKVYESYHPYGDQEWIRNVLQCDVLKWQDLFAAQFSSLKVDCIHYNKKPPKTKIVFYHGRPSIVESLKIPNFKWIGKYWDENITVSTNKK